MPSGRPRARRLSGRRAKDRGRGRNAIVRSAWERPHAARGEPRLLSLDGALPRAAGSARVARERNPQVFRGRRAAARCSAGCRGTPRARWHTILPKPGQSTVGGVALQRRHCLRARASLEGVSHGGHTARFLDPAPGGGRGGAPAAKRTARAFARRARSPLRDERVAPEQAVLDAGGQTLLQFRNRCRLDRFFELYGDGSRRKMVDAALDAGFGSYPQFHRVFRAQIGCAPAEYFRVRAR